MYNTKVTEDRLAAGLYPFRDGEVVVEAQRKLDELHAEAQELIDNEDPLCYDVAASLGQQFENVKHMMAFRYAILDSLLKKTG